MLQIVEPQDMLVVPGLAGHSAQRSQISTPRRVQKQVFGEYGPQRFDGCAALAGGRVSGEQHEPTRHSRRPQLGPQLTIHVPEDVGRQRRSITVSDASTVNTETEKVNVAYGLPVPEDCHLRRASSVVMLVNSSGDIFHRHSTRRGEDMGRLSNESQRRGRGVCVSGHAQL
ncbi:hypothetical protein [Streptomyces sp. NPDC019890]|uniref:hypothetical protein n=1 Tax=Streptomyces sp. NPDC019890 TaxID=3365064 RepID=UPI00384EBFB2